MKSIYIRSENAEKIAKARFEMPEFLMMENAASRLEDAVFDACGGQLQNSRILVLCGNGNNGGDGYALARRLFGKAGFVAVLPFGLPKTTEAAGQKKMCQAIGVQELNAVAIDSLQWTVIVDCIFGTGFHGELDINSSNIIQWCNKQQTFRLACDIPSGLGNDGVIATKTAEGQKIAFCAHKTVTMGGLKTALFSDDAKDFVGTVAIADLGISPSIFESCATADAFLLEESDIKLPLRDKKSVHKGNFGHAAVVLGQKPGAGIIAGTAALRFGAGFVSVIDVGFCKKNFALSPELMVGSGFPAGTTAVLIGSGLGRRMAGDLDGKTDRFLENKSRTLDCELSMAMEDGEDFVSAAKLEELVNKTLDFVENAKSPAIVLDADFFYLPELKSILDWLNCLNKARVILTPHPKEFAKILWETDCFLDDQEGELKKLAAANGSQKAQKDFLQSVVAHRFEYGRKFAARFPNLVLVAKGANTYIFQGEKIFVCTEGTNALAKAGSGDVLAGLCVSLLAQGYSALDAANTAVFEHGKAGARFLNNWECSPLSLIQNVLAD